MLWDEIVKTLGGMAILVAAMAWLARSLINSILSKELEKFKSDLQISAHRHAVEYSSLHARRAEYIAELYSKSVKLYQGIISLSMELGKRSFRAEQYENHEKRNAEPWEIKEGIHTLSPEEEIKAKSLHKEYKEFMSFYNEKKIYFSEEVCSLIESFANLAGYMGVMYQNVALRDEDDSPYINPMVEKTWFKAGEKVPKLLEELEKEFRMLLGVSGGKA
ncbi:MAG: hypothetical protein R3E61_00040 [Pseudomonadales bacterium]